VAVYNLLGNVSMANILNAN